MNDRELITGMIMRRSGDHSAEGRTIIDYLLIIEQLLKVESESWPPPVKVDPEAFMPVDTTHTGKNNRIISRPEKAPVGHIRKNRGSDENLPGARPTWNYVEG